MDVNPSPFISPRPDLTDFKIKMPPPMTKSEEIPCSPPGVIIQKRQPDNIRPTKKGEKKYQSKS